MDELTRLLLRAHDGDERAFVVVVEALERDVRRLVSHLGPAGPAETDDVVQDTFVRLWHALERYRGDASARTFTLVLARRACVDAIRRRERRRRLVRRVADHHSAHDEVVTGGELAHELRVLLDELVPTRREAFVLTQLVGLAYDEAAAVLDVPVGTIRSRVSRAREDLVHAWRDRETG